MCCRCYPKHIDHARDVRVGGASGRCPEPNDPCDCDQCSGNQCPGCGLYYKFCRCGGRDPFKKNPRRKKTTIMLREDAGVEAFAMDRHGNDVPAKYVVTCEAHNTFAGSSSLRDARVIAAYPENFCDGCRT
jgi:hypothetical protein